LLAVFDNPLLQAISSAAMNRLNEFRAQELANTAWACAKLLWQNLPLLDAIASASRPRLHDQFNTLNMTNTAWAWAALSLTHAPLIDALSAESLPHISEFEAQQLHNSAWAFARLLVKDHPLLGSISAVSFSKATEFGLQGISNPAWAFAVFQFEDHPIGFAFVVCASAYDAVWCLGVGKHSVVVSSPTHASPHAPDVYDSSFCYSEHRVVDATRSCQHRLGFCKAMVSPRTSPACYIRVFDTYQGTMSGAGTVQYCVGFRSHCVP